MITLVTDSTAYLTKEEADRLKLRVVPMHYTIAGNSYTEGFADENQNFVDKIAANPDLCATAQASVADFVGMFQAIVHQGGEVLCVVISSRLSGAYSSACICAFRPRAVPAQTNAPPSFSKQRIGRMFKIAPTDWRTMLNLPLFRKDSMSSTEKAMPVFSRCFFTCATISSKG